MNTPTSSSSSSSGATTTTTTTTTTTLELNVSGTAMGCLSGVLHRLLCHNAARQTPREAKQVSRDACMVREEKVGQSPGLVARLMGLDSMPVFPYTPSSSMGRSRSTSSLESWPVFLSSERCSGSPKMRTSVSFREGPTFLRQENEDFLLLTFTCDDKVGSFEPTEVKVKKELRQVKEMKRREQKRNSKHRGERRKAEDSVRLLKKREVEPEISSQNSSPDSVLDNAFGIDEDKKKLEQRRSRRKLSSELDHVQCSTPRIKFNIIVDDGGFRSHKEDRNRNYGMRKNEKPGHGLVFSDLQEHSSRFADEDVKRSKWFSMGKSKSEEAGEIAFMTGLHILDFLLHEVVSDLLYLN